MPLEDELKELKQLKPAERLAKLKELEEKKREEHEEAEQFLKETENEASQQEDERLNLPVPQMRAIDPDSLETIEARLLWAAKRGITIDRHGGRDDTRHQTDELGQRVQEEAAEKKAEFRQYGDAIEKARTDAVAEAYKGRDKTQIEETYGKINQEPQMNYQKPEVENPIVYEQRSATAGHERQPQDFYTTNAQKKKRG